MIQFFFSKVLIMCIYFINSYLWTQAQVHSYLEILTYNKTMLTGLLAFTNLHLVTYISAALHQP